MTVANSKSAPVVILNLCSPYDSLFSDGLCDLAAHCKLIIILTDNSKIIKNTSKFKFIYCKSRGLGREVDVPEYSEAMRFDRYCTYYPETLFFPGFLKRQFHRMTGEVLAKVSDELASTVSSTSPMILVSEPPASALGVFLESLLRQRSSEPYYFTSSRIYDGFSIITHSNDGDRGALRVFDVANIAPAAKVSAGGRGSLKNSTNRRLINKIYRYLRGWGGAVSIYPAWMFRLFCLWRHCIYHARSVISKYLFRKYTIAETRVDYPGKKICVVYLQFEPEVSTLYWMRRVSSQMAWLTEIIESEADSVFLIREHTHFLGYRPISDYRMLLRYSNVRLAEGEESDVVRACADQLLSFSGTVGYECAANGVFHKFRCDGNPFYLDLVAEGGRGLSPERLQDFVGSLVPFESDPAMPRFNSAVNRQEFVRLIHAIVDYHKSG
jgi:hypothetical protein